MLPSSSSDASICLRCHLRVLLRQVAPRSHATFRQRRYQSSESGQDGDAGNAEDDGSQPLSNPRIRYTTEVSHGFIKNHKPREPRFRETIAKLPIASLNEETEVIVLRHTPRKRSKITTDPVEASKEDAPEDALERGPALTAKDIQSFGDKRNQKVSQDEVNASIDSLGFEKEEVVTQHDFDAKVKHLTVAYNTAQLRKYMRQPRFQFRKAPAPTPIDSPDGPASPHSIRFELDVTPWTPLRAGKQAPESGPAPESNAAAKKRRVAENILRQCWGVRIDNEFSRVGELDIRMLPEQFNLWKHSTLDSLKRLLPSSPFYKHSQLQVYPAERTIRLKGPRVEVDSMVDTIRAAYKDSDHVVLELAGLKSLLSEGSKFSDIFSLSQLRQMMSLTNSYLEYDDENEKIRISSFDKYSISDASRILLSLLHLPTRSQPHSVSVEQSMENCYLMPNVGNKGMPYRYRFRQLGRCVQSVTKKEISGRTRNIKTSARAEKIALAERIYEQMSKMQTNDVEGLYKTESYWNSIAEQLPWKARLGHVLRPMSGISPTELDSSSLRVSDAQEDQAKYPGEALAFLPRFPANLGVLSQLGTLRGTPEDASTSQIIKRRYFIRPPVQLIAKLIPSPLTELGLGMSRLFPEVALKFQEELPVPGPRHRADRFITEEEQANASPELRFRGMQATLDCDIIDVPLPQQPVDIRMERKRVLKSRHAEKDPQIEQFISTVLESEKSKEGAIRAPRRLSLKMPVWALRPRHVETWTSRAAGRRSWRMWEKIREQEEVEMDYLFAGFEYRERRNIDPAQEELDKDIYFSPDHLLRVEHIEGGLMFGKKTQATILPKMAPVALYRHPSFRQTGDDGLLDPESASGLESLKSALRSDSLEPAAGPDSQDDMERKERDLVRVSLSVIDLIAKIQKRDLGINFQTTKEKKERSWRATKARMGPRRPNALENDDDVEVGDGKDVVEALVAAETDGEGDVKTNEEEDVKMNEEEDVKMNEEEDVNSNEEEARELDVEEGAETKVEEDARTDSVVEARKE